MWTTIYIATGEKWALEVVKKLEAEGFVVKRNYLGEEDNEKTYEILAPSFESEDIQLFMLESGIL